MEPVTPSSTAQHQFEERTFTKPTYCDYCTNLLWGLTKQGVVCKVCGYASHDKCQELVGDNCRMFGEPHSPTLGRSNTDMFAASRNIPSTQYNRTSSARSSRSPSPSRSVTSTLTQPLPIQGQSRPKSVNYPSPSSSPITRSISLKTVNLDLIPPPKPEPTAPLPPKPMLRRSSSVDSIASIAASQALLAAPKVKAARQISAHALPSSKTDDPIPKDVPLTSLGAKVIQDLIASSSAISFNASKLPSDATHPPLNLQTVTINFKKFVQKCGFIFATQDAIEDLVTWKNSANTLLAMVIYVYLCLYPQLIILLPLVGLLTILIFFHQKRFPNGPAQPPPTGKKGKKLKKSKRTDPTLPAENSVDYLKNMQSIQNFMGMVSDGYDAFVPLLKHIDWSNEQESLRITQLVVLILTVMSVVIWFVSWRKIFIVAGLSVFIANNKFVKTLTKEMTPLIMQRGTTIIDQWREYFSSEEEEEEDE